MAELRDMGSTGSPSAKEVQALRRATGAGMMDCKRALIETNGNFDESVKWLRENGLMGAAKRLGRESGEGAVSVARQGNVAAVVELRCETDFVARSPDFVSLAEELAQVVLDDGEQALDSRKEAVDDLNIKLKENIALGRVMRVEAGEGHVVDTYLHVQGDRGVNAVIVELDGGTQELAHDLAIHIAFARPVYVSRDEVPAEEVAEERAMLEAQTRNEGKPEQAIPKIVEGKLGGFFKDRVLLDQSFVRDEKRTVTDLLGGVRVVRFVQVTV